MQYIVVECRLVGKMKLLDGRMHQLVALMMWRCVNTASNGKGCRVFLDTWTG